MSLNCTICDSIISSNQGLLWQTVLWLEAGVCVPQYQLRVMLNIKQPTLNYLVD